MDPASVGPFLCCGIDCFARARRLFVSLSVLLPLPFAHEKAMPDVFEASGMAEVQLISAGSDYFVFTGVLNFGPK